MLCRAPPDMSIDTNDSAAERLAFEAADDDLDSHVPAILIATGIVGLIALLAFVAHMEVLL